MSQRAIKILRAGAKKFKLPYNELKKNYEKLDSKQKEYFLKQAKISLNLL